MKDNIDNIEDIKINLLINNQKYGNSKHILEYLEILINEIKRLRNKGNPDEELKKENIDLKNEIKELKNIIQSYESNNKNNFKNKYDKKDIISLDNFNKKFGLKIPNNQIKKLNFDNFKLGNNFFEALSRVRFNNLEKLYLANNDINNIKYL